MSAQTEYAITINQTEKAELLPVEEDTQVGPQEIAGPSLATLVSAGTELNSGYLASEGFPKQSGYAAVMQVEKVGANVQRFQPGDIAFCMRPHRSYQKFDQNQALPVPAGLSPQVATFARMMGVSMTTLNTTSARPPSRVLICGLGLVGHLAAKNFAACGYEVFASDPVESRRALATQAGIPNVSAAVPLDDDDLCGTFSLAVECSGHEQALLDAAKAVCKRGEVVCIATPWRPFTDLPLHELHRVIFFNYVVVRSGWEWELPNHPADFSNGSVFGNLAGALNWLAEKRVAVDSIYSTYSPRDAQQAYQDLLHKKTDRLAVVFDWTQI